VASTTICVRRHRALGFARTRLQRSVDEAHAGASVDIAVFHLLPARAAPVEVHLADQEPVAAGIHCDNASIMARAACALHTARETHDGARSRRRSMLVWSIEDIGPRGIHDLRPPVAPAKARAIHVVRRVDVIDAAVTAGWDLPLRGRFRVEVHTGAARLATGAGGWRPAGASSRVAARVAGGRRATDVGHPGGIVRDQSAAGVAVPALSAMQRAIGPAIAEPAALQLVARLVAEAGRAGASGWREAHQQRGDSQSERQHDGSPQGAR